MKRICLFLLAIAMLLPAMGQEKMRIAVFDPTSSSTAIDGGTKEAIRESVSSTIVNLGKYEIAERALLEKIMQEQKFSLSGAVDDDQVAEIGKLTGANKIIVSVVTVVNTNILLTLKLIDVNTGNIEKQQLKTVSSTREMLHEVSPMTMKLLGEKLEVADGDGQSAAGDLELFLAPGSFPDYPICIYINDEFIGSGTLSDGFDIKFDESRLKDLKKGKSNKYKLKVEVLNTVEYTNNNMNNANNTNNGNGFKGIKIGGFAIGFNNNNNSNNNSSKEEMTWKRTTKHEIDLNKNRYYAFKVKPVRKMFETMYEVELK